MKNLWIIIQREYLVRVKKKSFFLITLLTPLALGLFFVVVGLILSYQGDQIKNIGVIDPTGILENRIKDENNYYFKLIEGPIDETLLESHPELDGVLLLPEIMDLRLKDYTIYYYSDGSLDLEAILQLQSIFRQKVRDYKVKELNIDVEELDMLATAITIDPEPISTDEQTNANNPSPITSIIGAGIGGIMGFLMYLIVFLNGMTVMKSVMEEKINRIVEIMISAVKPFELMLGKIIGVGGVGLTQIAIWAIIIPIIYFAAQLVFGWTDPQQLNGNLSAVDADELQVMITQAMGEIDQLNWWLILPCFIFFFLGGYILYASLFAAVGSAVGDDMSSGQALTIPITLPIVLALYIMFVVIRVPNSTLAVFASLFPLFSPIVMPARIAFSPPLWQIIISVILLTGTVLGAVWVSARVYRIGILSYGKKVTFKEIIRWTFQKN